MNRNQLRLIETPRVTRIDEETKAIGRRGLAKARAMLAEVERKRADREAQQRPGRPSAA